MYFTLVLHRFTCLFTAQFLMYFVDMGVLFSLRFCRLTRPLTPLQIASDIWTGYSNISLFADAQIHTKCGRVWSINQQAS